MADLRYFAAFTGRDSNASASSSSSSLGRPQQTRAREPSPHRLPRSGATFSTILPARGREAMDLLADVAASDRGASWHKIPPAAPSRYRRMMGTGSPLSSEDAYDSAFPHASSPKTPSDDDDLLSDEASDRHSSASPFSTPYGSYESPAANYKRHSHLDNDTPKLRRRYSSATDGASNEGREVTSSAEPDVIHVQFPVTISSGSGAPGTGKRRRHVPDSMQTIACYFCRRRKIKCGTPQGDEKSCPPCAKRQLPCEYAEKSNRGMRTDLMRRKQEASQGEPYRTDSPHDSSSASSSASPTPPSAPAPAPATSHPSHATTRLPPVSALTGGNTFAYPYFPARPRPPSPLPRLSEIVRPPAYSPRPASYNDSAYLAEKQHHAQGYYSEPRSVPRPHRYPHMHLSGPAVHPLPSPTR